MVAFPIFAAGTSTVGSQERARAEELIAEATELLAKQTRPRVPRSEYPAPNRARELGIPFHRSAGNPASVPLAIHFDGDSAQATVTIHALQEGPPDSAHGGPLAWLMDCMTGALVQSPSRPSVTGTLELRYERRKFGRASCSERVSQSVELEGVGVFLPNKKQNK